MVRPSKSTEDKVKKASRTAQANAETTKPLELLPKSKRNRLGGVVYIGSLPKGFGEEQLRSFFEQFGAVARVCVARSQKTQRPKGYGYVQFVFYEVAEIAAKAVNNYMMFSRLLRANVLPRQLTTIPRNFGRVYNSQGEQTAAHKAWLERQTTKANAYVGGQAALSHRVKQLKRLTRSQAALAGAGVEVPALDATVAKLQKRTAELKRANKLPDVKPNAPEQEQEEEEEEEEEEEQELELEEEEEEADDDDEDFAPLQPSEWDQPEPKANGPEDAEERNAAIAKAEQHAKTLRQPLTTPKPNKATTIKRKKKEEEEEEKKEDEEPEEPKENPAADDESDDESDDGRKKGKKVGRKGKAGAAAAKGRPAKGKKPADGGVAAAAAPLAEAKQPTNVQRNRRFSIGPLGDAGSLPVKKRRIGGTRP